MKEVTGTTAAQRTGRVIVLAYIAVLVLRMVTEACFAVTRDGYVSWLVHGLRLFIGGGLCLWLYQGSKFAKWFMVVTSVGAALNWLRSLGHAEPASIAIRLTWAALCFSFAVVMVASSRVNSFFAHQRGETQATVENR